MRIAYFLDIANGLGGRKFAASAGKTNVTDI